MYEISINLDYFECQKLLKFDIFLLFEINILNNILIDILF